MQYYSNAIDESVVMGDLATAMRYKWAELAHEQSTVGPVALSTYLRPDVFLFRPMPVVAAAQERGHKIVFAHFQKNPKGEPIPFWHVCDKSNKFYQSTRSIQGLREAGLIR